MRNLVRKGRAARQARESRRPEETHGLSAHVPAETQGTASAEAGEARTQPPLLRPGRLEGLIHQVAKLYRKAHLTADEWRYVPKRVRQALGLRARPARAKRLPEILAADELHRMFAQAYRERGLYGLIVRALFETGLRVSELVRIEVADTDLLERTIRVREGKGGKDRLVVFTEDLAQQLRLHLNGRTRGALFESNRAAPFTPRRIQQIVKAVARQAGIGKPIHPHTYRHSMATFLRNQGVPLDVVQLLLGHADPRTTQLYARLSLGTARAAYDQAMAALAGRKSSGEPDARHEQLTRDLEGPEGRATS
jgi:integrase/recombinase XerD